MAVKPKFDPNQSFTVVQDDQMPIQDSKPAFNPNQPFEVASERDNENPGLLSRSLDIAGRVLDYPGGFMRAGLANVGGLLSGKGSVTRPEDLAAAAKGKGPNSAEYLERLGVTPGPSIDLPWLGNTSLRDAEGFALDVGTDPLTTIAKGIKYFRPASAAAERTGTSIYKSGLKKVDERLAEKGAGSLSDLLLSEGKTGTTKTLAKDTEALGKAAQAERANLYAKATEKGAKVDMSQILDKSTEAIESMKSDPGLRPTAEKLEDLVNRYKQAGAVDLATASEWKTNLYNALPETAYDAHGKLKGPAAKVQKALANDFKTGIITAGNAAEEGLGDSINALNERMQTTLTAKKPLAMQARRAETPNLVTSVDAMLGAGAAMASHDPRTTLGVLAAKKAADAAKTTYVRTKSGKGLIDIGRTGLLDATARRGLIGNKAKKSLIDDNNSELLQTKEGE